MSEYLKRLKDLRIAKDVSQREVAEYLGVSVAAYSLYEVGKREPNISTLKKLAKYYNVSPSYLLGWDESKKQPGFYIDDVRISPANLHSMVDQVMNMKNEPISAGDLKKVKVIIKNPENAQHTIAAHFDGDEFTTEELEEIKRYAEFLKSKRKPKEQD